MNKQLSATELGLLSSVAPHVMTRREKLLRFFELSKNDLHEFSCDCGGVIRNDTMADRIEAVAGRAAL